MDILGMTITFLGGGILVALINWSYASRAATKEREINFLDSQIRKLYGPLYYLTSQAEKLFELNDRFHKAYQAEYIDEKYSNDVGTQNILDSESTRTIDIANKYIKIVEKNNKNIHEILFNSYHYIDPEDIETFLLFNEHYIRKNTEFNNDGSLETPIKIYKHIGKISFLRPEFISKVKEKFLLKKSKLENLIKKQ